ncbi:OLC1v1003352C1 [Oldenlandia corymbosa var. corymbosa]|uniref:peptidylprolyl isomerase n=1 Tax=Oldenlandia corymbosa var. corymbosa TaxID=529605 RepID=A0AAV1DC80_OLDCO|nr:OLC1v1003352C1 [Oldenlandia corymbosa var. corymbosa]
MSFWGIEVKPGKPVTHSFEKVKRRLRISQATLGIGTAVKTSLVQCNVGNKTPVFICALLPTKTESLHLDLEFEEAEDVTFSVIGPRSVYLTGYYVGNSRHSALLSKSESFGEDIANSETERSVHDSDDDEYDDSFIDDGDPEVFPPSPVQSDGDTEDLVDNDNADRKGGGRRRQKIILSDSEDQTSSPENEDEDRVPLSALIRKKAVKNGYEMEEKTEDRTVGINEHINTTCSPSSAPKGKVDAATLLQKPNSELSSPKKTKSKRKRKRELDGHEEGVDKQSKVLQTKAEDQSQHQDSLQPSDANQRITALDIDGETPRPKMDGPSSKKRKKGVKEKSNGSIETAPNGQLKGNTAAVGKDVKKLPAPILKYKKPNTDTKTNSDLLPEGSRLEEPKKKKKDKTKKKNKEDVNVSLSSGNESGKPSESCQMRSLTNGLVIEELTSGNQDGKAATLGRKVKVYYTGRLKESGRVIDSNIGKAPYKFRLGDEEVIGGWNVGIEGMRVGDKRRLTVPPSLGYGEQGNGENVPPNSWLEFDIELVRAH